MEKIESIGIQAIISTALAAFASYLGALAVATGSLSSKVGAKGIIKKVGYMALIVVAMGVDYLICSGISAASLDLPYTMWFGLLVAVWLIINEMISILENLDRLDVPIPGFLRAIVKKLKISADGKDEKND